jgi:hypothetical protein
MKYRFWSASIVASTLLLAIQAASAGQVYGTVVGKSGSVKTKAVTIICGNETKTKHTDKYGSYSININASGRCKIRVDKSEPLSVRVYKDEVRYDLRLTGNDLELK